MGEGWGIGGGLLVGILAAVTIFGLLWRIRRGALEAERERISAAAEKERITLGAEIEAKRQLLELQETHDTADQSADIDEEKTPPKSIGNVIETSHRGSEGGLVTCVATWRCSFGWSHFITFDRCPAFRAGMLWQLAAAMPVDIEDEESEWGGNDIADK